MYRLDRKENSLVQLEQPRFADSGLLEREHLQEWLVGVPDVLGEELLIIQKEFAGFEGTRERLGLLVLDKEGRLVVIENKLNSGRDVVWQALKYVSYCASLKKAEIIDIYQKYLNHLRQGEDARTNLCEFLDVDELDSVVLNAGSYQRLMLVATSFRKEVTTPVLWLLDRGVQAQCFRVVAYAFEQEIFIDMQQIIPTPEASDYMIGMAAKHVCKRWQGLRWAQAAPDPAPAKPSVVSGRPRCAPSLRARRGEWRAGRRTKDHDFCRF